MIVVKFSVYSFYIVISTYEMVSEIEYTYQKRAWEYLLGRYSGRGEGLLIKMIVLNLNNLSRKLHHVMNFTSGLRLHGQNVCFSHSI